MRALFLAKIGRYTHQSSFRCHLVAKTIESTIHINHDASPYFAGEKLICRLNDLAQSNFSCYFIRDREIQISCQTILGRDSIPTRTHHAVDPNQRHTSQDEGRIPCASPQAATVPP